MFPSMHTSSLRMTDNLKEIKGVYSIRIANRTTIQAIYFGSVHIVLTAFAVFYDNKSTSVFDGVATFFGKRFVLRRYVDDA